MNSPVATQMMTARTDNREISVMFDSIGSFDGEGLGGFGGKALEGRCVEIVVVVVVVVLLVVIVVLVVGVVVVVIVVVVLGDFDTVVWGLEGVVRVVVVVVVGLLVVMVVIVVVVGVVVVIVVNVVVFVVVFLGVVVVIIVVVVVVVVVVIVTGVIIAGNVVDEYIKSGKVGRGMGAGVAISSAKEEGRHMRAKKINGIIFYWFAIASLFI